MKTQIRKQPILPTLGARQPEWKIRYIRDNAASKTARQIQEVIGLSGSFIYDYCHLHGIPLKKVLSRHSHVHTPNTDKHKIVMPAPENPRVKFERPPAVYSNQSREQHIERILNAPL